jgi:hypothetical protein
MKKRLTIILSVAVIFLMCNCSDKAIAKYPFSQRQAKKIFAAKSSASSSAPGQLKKLAESQSAKPYAPGQQKKKKV